LAACKYNSFHGFRLLGIYRVAHQEELKFKILVTGGAGFIGSNFVRMALRGDLHFEELQEVIVLDKLTYAGDRSKLSEVEANGRFRFVQGDICDPELARNLIGEVEMVFNFAAESHVDNSINSSKEFFVTNVLGVQNLLDAVLSKPSVVFVQVSTDEVYGSIETGSWTEESPLLPNSPYAASKAGGDLVVRSYVNTHKLDARITRCANNYGPFQNKEKAIPNFIGKILIGENIGIYGTGENRREWIHVDDHCRAIALVAQKGSPGEIYNVPANIELSNNELAFQITNLLGVGAERVSYIKDRKGHDLRYSLSGAFLSSKLGFSSVVEFSEGLRATVNWYCDLSRKFQD
jgi:dTDP-glucose 4,6-dehydratase